MTPGHRSYRHWAPVRTRRLLVLAAVLAAPVVVASCGTDDGATSTPTSAAPTSADGNGNGNGNGNGAPEGIVPVALAVAERGAPDTDPAPAGTSVTDFGFRLFGAVRAEADGGNVTVSPASVAVALALVEPGATGTALDQLQEVLGIDDPATYHAAMSALEQSLEARTPAPASDPDQDPGELTARIVNAAYLQRGYPFEPAYLETIGTYYGPVLFEVDFVPDPDAVGHQINELVAEATNDRIPELIADGTIRPETVLALVNALYLKASWLEPFDPDNTTESPFTRLDGSEVSVSLMGGISTTSARGDGWVGATKAYVGNLEVQFILPDQGRFDEIANDLPAVVAAYEANRAGGGDLGLPRFETRFSAELSPPLKTLGLTAPYEPGGLLGIADDQRLVVDKVIHETFVAMDEEGTEAAAATAVLVALTGAPAADPVPVILDRPFLYRIVDGETGTTLFIGQMLDPTAP
jgi:serpin B